MKNLILFFCLALIAAGCTGTARDLPPLNAVPSVELDRYLGKWYEIASYPAWFAQDCTATTAEYTLLSDGKIQVVNRCRKGSLEGPLDESKGTAEITDPATNAKLKVTFFWPFKGDYWVINLDPDYGWAVVGEPSRKYLWILSRTPTMDERLYQDIVSRLPGKGYDPSKLKRMKQGTTSDKK